MNHKLIILLLIYASITFAQAPIYYDYSSTGNNVVNSGQLLNAAKNIQIGNSSYLITGTAQVEQKAVTTIHAVQGFHASGFTGPGFARLTIEPSLKIVASFHPSGFTGIPKYDKFEIGVKFPDNNIMSSVFNFINDYNFNHNGGNPAPLYPTGTLATKTNPYDPDVIYVECTYQKISGGQPLVRHAFYSPQKVIVVDNQNWGTSPSVFNPTTPANFPDDGNFFRIRFAPPDIGIWKGTVKMYVNNSLYFTYPDFTFDVTSSVNLGHLKMSSGPQFLKMQYDNGDLFYGIGRNIAYADAGFGISTDPCLGLPTNACTRYGSDYFSTPFTHSFQRTAIEDLADNSGNFVRIRLDDASVPVERNPPTRCNALSLDYLNNYYDWEKYMWEMDRTLATCEDRGIYILLTVTMDPLGTAPTEWTCNNPYSLLPGGSTRDDFFTQANHKSIFKKKLRYIEARWGYSTNIAAWEFFNEVENMGNWDQNLCNKVGNWVCEMKDEFKSPNVYPGHLVTVGTSWNYWSDASFNRFTKNPTIGDPDSTCLDFFVEHWYFPEYSHVNGNTAKYNDPIGSIIDIHAWYSGYWHTEQNQIWNNKPILLGEFGLGDISSTSIPNQTNSLATYESYQATILSPTTFHNQVWGSIFGNGLSISLQWHDWKIPYNFQLNPLHQQYKAVKRFVSDINFKQLLLQDYNKAQMTERTIAYNTNNGFTQFDGDSVATYWLRSTNRDIVYGWSRNLGANWMLDGYPAVAADVNNWTNACNNCDKWGQSYVTKMAQTYDYFGTQNPPPVNIVNTQNKTIVRGMLPNKKYDIKIYNAWDENDPTSMINGIWTDNNGVLRFGLNMPAISPNSSSTSFPDFAFIASVSASSRMNWDQLSEDSVKLFAQDNLCVQVGEKSQNVKHVWRTSNGTYQEGSQPCFEFKNAGTYLIVHEEYEIADKQIDSVAQKKIINLETKNVTVFPNNKPIKIELRPNPADNVIYLDGLDQITVPVRAEVINSIGQITKVNLENGQINVRGLNPGYYVLRLFWEGDLRNITFVVSR